MKRESKENPHETSPSPTQHVHCRKIYTGEKFDTINIPLDLTVEILKKLPSRSLMRFRCVSKQWSSIIDSRRDFIDSIVARSLTQPPPEDTHLIFYHQSHKFPESDFFIFSTAYPQDIDKEAISTLGGWYQYVRGLIFCCKEYPSAASIYNPTTRQSFSLPEMKHQQLQGGTCLFGYDHVENQYKVVCVGKYMKQSCHVYTLGDPIKEWRNIQCDIELHFPLSSQVCIDGVIYFRATTELAGSTFVFMSFDVRSEIFDQIQAPETQTNYGSTLINYQGKLGFMCCENGVEIWVMEKQGWSKIIFYDMEGFEKTRIAGVTRGGEIVFVDKMLISAKTLYVSYYDPKGNSMRRVVKGIMVEDMEHLVLVWAVPDQVENTMRL